MLLHRLNVNYGIFSIRTRKSPRVFEIFDARVFPGRFYMKTDSGARVFVFDGSVFEVSLFTRLLRLPFCLDYKWTVNTNYKDFLKEVERWLVTKNGNDLPLDIMNQFCCFSVTITSKCQGRLVNLYWYLFWKR